jgi:rsbT co-antagonist protein RsbR
MQKASTAIPRLIDKHSAELLRGWLAGLAASDSQTDAGERSEQATRFIAALRQGAETGQLDDITTPGWASTREVLEAVSRARAQRGASSVEMATFIFALKEPVFEALRRELGKDADALATEIWTATRLLDRLGLYTVEVFQKSREAVILRQKEEMLELSTPVVQLWAGILALPLIGTLDSARTQVVMENLLQHIVTSGAEIAIIDITGVPTVDTLVAQHLLKTISAARLMGADCIISGIRPQIAQTMVHLGVELDVVSKSTMADALALALRRIGKIVVDRTKPAQPAE